MDVDEASAVAPATSLSRRELLTLLSAIMALSAVAIDLMLPVFDDIRVAFDLRDGSADTGLVVTTFFLGLALGQVGYGPLADRFGRKPTLRLGIAIYVLGAVGSALAPSFALLLASRFVWGIGAAGSRVVATAIIRDRFVGSEMARAMSQIMAVFILVPIVAPSLGALIAAVVPWRGVFWFCVVWALLIGLWSTRLDETLRPADRRSLSVATTARGFAEVCRTHGTAGYTLATVFLYAVFTAYVASSEVIISDIFGRESEFPIVFGAVATLFGAGALLNGRLVVRHGLDPVVRVTLLAQLPLCVLLVLVSLAGGGQPSFWVFMPVLALILSSFMFLMPNLTSASMTPVGHIAGTASALTGAIRIAGGALIGTWISGYVDTSVTPFAFGVTAMCISGAITVAVVRARGPVLADDDHRAPSSAGSPRATIDPMARSAPEETIR